MTAATIDRLLSQFPDNELHRLFPDGREPFMSDDAVVSTAPVLRYALAYKQLSIGWRMGKLAAELNIDFPAGLSVSDEPVFRCYIHHINPLRFKDDALQHAIALTLPGMRQVSATLKALLVAREADVFRISSLTGIPAEVIHIYEKLFFNVRDRMRDHAFLAMNIFPMFRFKEHMDGYVASTDGASLLLRSGATNGVMDVMRMAGLQAEDAFASAATSVAPELERWMLSEAFLLARNGFLSDRTHGHALHHARSLMTAGKMSGEGSSAGDEMESFGNVMADEMNKFLRSSQTAAGIARTRRLSEEVTVMTSDGDE